MTRSYRSASARSHVTNVFWEMSCTLIPRSCRCLPRDSRYLSLCIFITFSAWTHAVAQRVGEEMHPVAARGAVVIAGHARFTVLTDRLIRLEWSADGKFEDRASLAFINRQLPVPAFTETRSQSAITIKTGSLELRYAGQDRFSDANLTIRMSVTGQTVDWKPGLSGKGNLLGTARTLDGVNGQAVLEQGILSRDGWALIDDSKRPLFDDSDWPWVMERPKPEEQDWYFFGYGHAYKDALGEFTRVAGKIPLPPRFVFGDWWSRYWAYTDEDLIHLIDEFESNHVPLDVLVLDMDWHLPSDGHTPPGQLDPAGQTPGWTGYTWNKDLFPDPKGFLNFVHQQGLKATLNLHPASGVQPYEDAYPAMATAMGIDPATRKYVPFDITNKRFAINYLNLLHHPLEAQGIDFFWLDWQQGETTRIPGLDPIFWLNYVHFTDMEREGKRPLLFHRWGGLGNHRYQIGFSGDTISTWDSLAFQPYFTATAGNVGYGYWSHDIGGHMPGPVDPELYTRWVQFGAFSPVLRTHATKNPDAERRIWAFAPQYAEPMRQAMLLRHSLVPYLYTAAREAFDTGVSLLRPLYYESPEQEEAYAHPEEYEFGDSMLVSPITAPVDPWLHLARKQVWLPEGDWIEWATGKLLKGGTTIERNYFLDQIPVFLKAGSIVSMQPDEPSGWTSQRSVIQIFPGGPSVSRVYDDSDRDEGYKRGEFSWTPIRTARPDDRTTIVTIDPMAGGFPGMATTQTVEVRLFESWPPTSVEVAGRSVPYDPSGTLPLGWHYVGDQLTTVVRLGTIDRLHGISVKLWITEEQAHESFLLNGAVGLLDMYVRAFHQNGNQGPKSLIGVADVGRRITLHPETALAELRSLHSRRDLIQSDVQAFSWAASVQMKAVELNQTVTLVQGAH